MMQLPALQYPCTPPRLHGAPFEQELYVPPPDICTSRRFGVRVSDDCNTMTASARSRNAPPTMRPASFENITGGVYETRRRIPKPADTDHRLHLLHAPVCRLVSAAVRETCASHDRKQCCCAMNDSDAECGH